jgi:hypothetical protein
MADPAVVQLVDEGQALLDRAAEAIECPHRETETSPESSHNESG